ncbi:MAG: F0F1 ATP synthase subunit B [bacterium]|nr:F0F1 ATP synthase subunit B [bacterium]
MDQLNDILTKIGFDWQLALASLVNFLIIFWILKRYFFKPLGDTIEERQKRIEGGLRDAHESELALLRAKEECQLLIIQAKKEAEEVISSARDQARLLEDRAKKKIVALRDEEMAKAQQEIAKERDELMATVKRSAAELVGHGMMRVFEEELDRSAQERVVTRLVTR